MLFDIWQRATKKEKALMFCGRFKYNLMWIFHSYAIAYAILKKKVQGFKLNCDFCFMFKDLLLLRFIYRAALRILQLWAQQYSDYRIRN